MDLRSIMLSEKPALKGLHLYSIPEKRSTGKADMPMTSSGRDGVDCKGAQGKRWNSPFDVLIKLKTTLKMEKKSFVFLA